MKACTGCNRLESEPLGRNTLGELYFACCPDNDYRDITPIDWYTEEVKFIISQLVFGGIKHREALLQLEDAKEKAKTL